MVDHCPSLECDVIARDLGVAGVGISIGGQPFDASDSTSRVLEGSQFVLGEGPFVDVIAHNAVVELPDASSDDIQWLRFVEVMNSCSIRAVFSFPLAFERACVGAFTLYSKEIGCLSDQRRRLALASAAEVAITVVGHVRAQQVEHHHECGLHRVDRFNCAVGLAMHDLGVGAGDAMMRIRSHAYANECLVDEVVDELITQRLRLSEF